MLGAVFTPRAMKQVTGCRRVPYYGHESSLLDALRKVSLSHAEKDMCCVAQAQLVSDALDLGFDGLRTNIKEHMVKVPEDSHPASAPA